MSSRDSNVFDYGLPDCIGLLSAQGVSLQVQGESSPSGCEAVGLAASTSLVTLVIGIKALYEIRGIPMVSGVSGALRRYCTKVQAKKVSCKGVGGVDLLLQLLCKGM